MIYLFHGFNVSDKGEATTDKLKDYLDAVDVDYGWEGRIKVRTCTSSQAKIIAAMAEPDSIAIGHSNGCNLIYHACEQGAPFRKAIFINPALDSDLAPKNVDSFSVYHSPSDSATLFAKFIPFSSWGSMGRNGYTGDDPRATNHNLEELTNREIGHSDAFLYPLILEMIAKEAI